MSMRRLRGAIVGVTPALLLALVLLLPVACGGSTAASPSPTITVTPTAMKGTTVRARVGDTIVIKLEANATTGYEWTFTPGDTFRIVGSEYVADANAAGLEGVGGAQVVTLEVTAAGSSELTGMYRRAWETPTPGAPTFVMTVFGAD